MLCTLWVLVPELWNMVFNKGIWDPQPKNTSIKGTDLKSLNHYDRGWGY